LRKIILFILCSMFLFGCSDNTPELHDTQNNAVKITALKNKWVIVNYWAAWCGSCIAEIPELNHFYQHNKDSNVMLYGYNYDQLELTALQNSVSKMKLAFPIWVEDPSPVWSLGEVTSLPTTFIINPKGEVVRKIVGPSTEEALQTIIHTLQQQYA